MYAFHPKQTLGVGIKTGPPASNGQYGNGGETLTLLFGLLAHGLRLRALA